MFLLLIACGAIYLLLGDKGEAAMLLAFVFVIIGITFVQERKSERALEALRDLSSPRALVIRDGEQRRIAGREVVVGDLLMLAEGDRVAGGRRGLPRDESRGGRVAAHRRIGARRQDGRDGTRGAHGRARRRTVAVCVLRLARRAGQGPGARARDQHTHRDGQDRQRARRGSARAHAHPARDEPHRKAPRVVGAGLSVLVAVAYGLMHGEWLNAILAGITLTMAILPEELPVVLTIFLGLGAWRIAKNRVLTRHVPALEMLGSATVLCVDKTGTLTQNRMSLVVLHAGGQELAVATTTDSGLPEHFHELLEFAMLASQRDPFDPMDKAIKTATARLLAAPSTFISTGRSSTNIRCRQNCWRSRAYGNRPTAPTM